MKTIIICILFFKILFSADFIPSQSDPSWNYLFDEYEDKSISGAGIKDENIAIPAFTISNEILNTFIYALPEGQHAHVSHPEYFPSNEPEIIINQDAQAFVTFYSEGAGYRNTLGYYTYDGDTQRSSPTSINDLKEHGIIIFPNTSLQGSGGKMNYGLTVSLGILSENTKVVFFIISNGWTGNGIRNTDWIFSTKSSLNLEYDANSSLDVPNHKHVALLWNNVTEGNILLMGFEDILRTHNACDHDFNDVLFSFSTNPMSALSSQNGDFSQAPIELDSDEDGVSDAYDEFPNDAQRVYTTYYPKEDDYASLMFEDMWPKEGDYDMNDLIVEFNISEIKDNINKIKELTIDTKLKANGATYTNAFSIQIDSNIENIESSSLHINGIESFSNILKEDNGKTVITFFADAVKAFKKMDNYMSFANTSSEFPLCNDVYNRFINICKNRPSVKYPEIKVNIVFKESVILQSPPYNPFITVNNGESQHIEIHLPNFQPTSYADLSFFNTKDDVSDLSNNITYKTSEEKPWVLLVPTSFSYPLERINISDVYLHYNEWVNSELICQPQIGQKNYNSSNHF